MKVRELEALLKNVNPDAEVMLTFDEMGRVVSCEADSTEYWEDKNEFHIKDRWS